jgi:hypothetical protein
VYGCARDLAADPDSVLTTVVVERADLLHANSRCAGLVEGPKTVVIQKSRPRPQACMHSQCYLHGIVYVICQSLQRQYLTFSMATIAFNRSQCASCFATSLRNSCSVSVP